MSAQPAKAAAATKAHSYTQLFTLLGTPVTADPSAVITPLMMVGLGLWLADLRYQRPGWWRRVEYSLVSLVAYYLADFFHIAGHILSARHAGAPMDRAHLTAPLPLTLYDDNDVTPQAHCLRSIGGPIGSLFGTGLAWLISRLLPPQSILRDLFKLIALYAGLTGLGSFYPLPFIDGGTMLKWTLVDQGLTPAEADTTVLRTNLALGTTLTVGALINGKRLTAATLGLLGVLLTAGVAINKIQD
jgi:hypothetical protein